MDSVCLCIDLEGFYIPPTFHVREMGWCDHTGQHHGSLHYDPGLQWTKLTAEQHRHIWHVIRHIHGLSLHPPLNPLVGERIHPYHPVQALRDHVYTLYLQHATPQRNVVAYKGGHFERDLLKELRIPSLDLEEHGCPKFNDMLRLRTVPSCGQHRHNPQAHCAEVECYHFIQWMRGQCGSPRDMKFINEQRYNRFIQFSK